MNHPYISSLSISFPSLSPLNCSDLSAGLNVIYGPNEAGKSRIRDFIEWAMFVYESEHEDLKPLARKNAFNHLIPGISGRITAEISNKNVSIHLSRDSTLSEVKIENPDFSLSDIATALTDNMSRSHYKDIFSLSLDELSFNRSNKLLNEDELAEIFLNASQTGSGVSLSSLVSALKNQRDDLFSQSGNTRNKNINKTLRQLQEINKEISRLKRLENEFPHLEQELKLLTEQSNEFALEINEIDTYLKEKKDLIQWFERFTAYQEAVTVEPQNLNPELAKKYTEIEILLEEVKSSLSKEHERELLQSQLSNLNDEHEEQRKLLIQTLDPDELEEYAGTPDFISSVKRYEKSLQELTQSLLTTQEKIRENTKELSYVTELSENIQEEIDELDQVQPQIPIESPNEDFLASNPRKKVSFTKLLSAIGIIGGGIALGVGISISNVIVAGLGLVVAFIGLFPLFFTKQKTVETPLLIPDKTLEIKPLKNRLRENQSRIEHFESIISDLLETQSKIEKDLESKKTDYVDSLDRAGFKQYFDPNLIDIYLGAFTEYKARIHRINELKSKFERDDETINSLLKRTNSLIEYAKNSDAQIDIELETLATATTWLGSLLEASNIFRSNEELEKKRQQKIEDLEESLTEKFSSVDKAKEIFTSTSPETLEAEIESLLEQKTSLVSQRDDINQQIGSLRHQIDLASQSTELIEAIQHKNELIEDLRSESNEYLIRYKAAELAEIAFEKCQRENQPSVLRTASWMLRQATIGAWDQVSIVYSEQSKRGPLGQIQVSNSSNGHSILATQLSRGAQEQLYLALRFALMQTSVKGQHVPVLLDDIGVNFDIERFSAIASLIRDISFDRQIFYFTCHEKTRDILAELPGTKVVSI